MTETPAELPDFEEEAPEVEKSDRTGHMAYDTAELRFIGYKRDTAAQARKDIPKGAPTGRYEVRAV